MHPRCWRETEPGGQESSLPNEATSEWHKAVLSSVSEEFKDALWDPEIRGRVAT